MVLGNIIKRKKIEKSQETEKNEKLPKEKTKPKEPEKKEKTSRIIVDILKAPHITEKATDLTKENQYVFKVFPNANKTEIKKEIEELYKVNVLKVNIANFPSKTRRLGKIKGQKKGYKKIIVKIKAGQKIEAMPH